MFIAVIVIHIIVSLILIGAVLLQVGKGATIGSTFGGGAASQTVFGTSGGATFLGKVTTACAAIFMITSLFLTYTSSKQRDVSIMGELKEVTAPAVPAAPVVPELPAMEGKPDPEASMTAPAAESAAKPAPGAATTAAPKAEEKKAGKSAK